MCNVFQRSFLEFYFRDLNFDIFLAKAGVTKNVYSLKNDTPVFIEKNQFPILNFQENNTPGSPFFPVSK